MSSILCPRSSRPRKRSTATRFQYLVIGIVISACLCDYLVPNVKALDNISKCRWLLPPDDPNYRPQTKPKPVAPPATATTVPAAALPEPTPTPTAMPAAPAPPVPKESAATASQREQRTSVYTELICAKPASCVSFVLFYIYFLFLFFFLAPSR